MQTFQNVGKARKDKIKGAVNPIWKITRKIIDFGYKTNIKKLRKEQLNLQNRYKQTENCSFVSVCLC